MWGPFNEWTSLRAVGKSRGLGKGMREERPQERMVDLRARFGMTVVKSRVTPLGRMGVKGRDKHAVALEGLTGGYNDGIGH